MNFYKKNKTVKSKNKKKEIKIKTKVRTRTRKIRKTRKKMRGRGLSTTKTISRDRKRRNKFKNRNNMLSTIDEDPKITELHNHFLNLSTKETNKRNSKLDEINRRLLNPEKTPTKTMTNRRKGRNIQIN